MFRLSHRTTAGLLLLGAAIVPGACVHPRIDRAALERSTETSTPAAVTIEWPEDLAAQRSTDRRVGAFLSIVENALSERWARSAVECRELGIVLWMRFNALGRVESAEIERSGGSERSDKAALRTCIGEFGRPPHITVYPWQVRAVFRCRGAMGVTELQGHDGDPVVTR
jgi:hypothetical protein